MPLYPKGSPGTAARGKEKARKGGVSTKPNEVKDFATSAQKPERCPVLTSK